MRIGQRELVFFLVLAALPLAAYFWPWDTPFTGLKRWNAQIAEARQKVQKKQQKLDRLATMQKRIDSLGEEIDKLSRSIKKFEKKLPAQREVEVVLREVSKKARKHDLTLESFRGAQIEPAARYAELPIRMKISGGFDGFYSFLTDVENLPRITRVPSMNLKKLKKNDADGQMRASMVLSIFFESAKTNQSSDKANAI